MSPDGAAITDEGKAAVLDELVDDGARRGWKFPNWVGIVSSLHLIEDFVSMTSLEE